MSEPIRVERLVAAAPAAVFAHLVDAKLRAKWLGLASTLESRAGGSFEMLSPNGMTAMGEVVEVVADRKVSFTWGWQGHPGVPPGSTLVEIELIPDGDQTRVRLTHSELAVDEQPLHLTGWSHYLQRLAVVVSGGDAGLDPGAG